MERKIGETFEFEGKKLQVKESERVSCDGCFFAEQCMPLRKQVAGECQFEYRTDKKEVLFVEITEKQQAEQPQEQSEQPQGLNLCEILKNCPQGETLWSPMLGDVKFSFIDEERQMIFVETIKGLFTWEINADGTITIDELTSPEIMLYPSREQRNWSKFTASWLKKERFNPKTLQTFDKVLSRNSKNITWSIDYFSHMEDIYKPYQFFCLSDNYTYCIPYNDDTKHLVGTKDEAPDFYKYWED